jgi:hypothetical protein
LTSSLEALTGLARLANEGRVLFFFQASLLVLFGLPGALFCRRAQPLCISDASALLGLSPPPRCFESTLFLGP